MMNPIRPLLASLLVASSAQAFQVYITLENLAPSNPRSFYFTPVWTGFHDGSFDLFDQGSPASAGVEALAELGDSSLINTTFQSQIPTGLSQVQNQPGGPGPGVFAPGTSSMVMVDLDPMMHRYLSLATMAVPSNDAFLANDDPMWAPLFDGSGTFLGTQSWTITGAYDAGTEGNDPLTGAAFVMGVDATAGNPEVMSISMLAPDGLNSFIGVTTAAGTMIESGLPTDGFLRVTVSAVPEPSTSAALAGLAVLGSVLLSRRKRLPSS